MCYETAYQMSENLAMKSTVQVKSGVMTTSEPVSRTYTYRKGNYHLIGLKKISSADENYFVIDPSSKNKLLIDYFYFSN